MPQPSASKAGRYRRPRLAAVAAAVVLAVLPRLAGADTVTVAATATAHPALTEIAAAFGRTTGHEVRVVAADTEADIVVADDSPSMDALAARDALAGDSRVDLLADDLVIVVRGDSRIRSIDLATGCPLTLMMEGARLAIVDPERAPAGRAARTALDNLSAWITLERKIVPAPDATAVADLVDRGAAVAGIVLASDAAAAARLRIAGRFPADSYPPFVHPAALVGGRATPAARRFFAFLTAPEAAAVFAAHGFRVVPAEN